MLTLRASLVNNAGIAKFSGGILQETLEMYDQQMAVNGASALELRWQPD